jgi:multicomponent Na+:H+ antiporter subunit B
VTRQARLAVFAPAAAVLAVLLARAFAALPRFGGPFHPYGHRAVADALARHTANTVSAVNFDQRGLDTLVEESILFTAVLGTVTLLRQTRGERRAVPEPAPVDRTVRRYGVLALPVTVLIGLYVVAHGQLSPGGGFQGGVVLATALHLLYVAADLRALERLRPLAPYEVADALGEAAYTTIGVGGLVAGGAFLANTLPYGTLGALASGGTVPLLNAAVGLEVTGGVVVLLAHFLEQAVELTGGDTGDGGEGAQR